jgi:hypothetical protein
MICEQKLAMSAEGMPGLTPSTVLTAVFATRTGEEAPVATMTRAANRTLPIMSEGGDEDEKPEEEDPRGQWVWC